MGDVTPSMPRPWNSDSQNMGEFRLGRFIKGMCGLVLIPVIVFLTFYLTWYYGIPLFGVVRDVDDKSNMARWMAARNYPFPELVHK